MLEIKNTVTKMRDAFDRLFSRLDTAKERIHELKELNSLFSNVLKHSLRGLPKHNLITNGEICLYDL